MSELDLASPEFIADPYPRLARIREAQPLHKTNIGWIATRHEHVNAVLRNFRVWGAGITAQRRKEILGPGSMLEYASRRLASYDPPEHTRVRSLVTKGLTAKRVEALRPRIQAIADSLLESVANAPTFDVIEVLAHPLPCQVICEMIGVPLNDSEQLSEWTEAVQSALGPVVPRSNLAAANAAANEFMSYIRVLGSKRRAVPGDDLVSALVLAEDGGQRLTEDDLIAVVLFMFTAGHSTTRDLVGGGLIALMNNRPEWQRLADDPSMVSGAVEECLRYMPSITLFGRRALQDAVLADVPIAAGETVFVSIPAANRDPRRFPNPDAFDISRPDNEHLTFGGGIHYCLGATLARAEAQVILSTLVRRYPNMRLSEQVIEWRETPFFRGPKALHVTV